MIGIVGVISVVGVVGLSPLRGMDSEGFASWGTDNQ